MKKIIIVNNNLKFGGIQKSLINMINEIKDEYDVTLFLFSKVCDNTYKIPEGVKVVYAKGILSILGMSNEEAKNKNILLWLIRSFYVIFSRLFTNHLPLDMITKFNKRRIEKYDIAISYMHNSAKRSFYGGTNEFVINCINADSKITWVHCDIRQYYDGDKYIERMYKKFNKIIACSEGCKSAFIEALPIFSEKTYVIENFQNYEEIYKLSNIERKEYSKEYFNIVTVSRLGEEKGIDRAIQAIKKCVDKGFKLQYYIIGDGQEREKLEKMIKNENLEKSIFLCGQTNNPYRYIKNADLFLLPSYHEAAPMVFYESAFLRVPILTTQTTSTYEMIEKNNIGWVCENSLAGIENKLLYVLNNKEEVKKKKEFTKTMIYNNEKTKVKLKEIIGR